MCCETEARQKRAQSRQFNLYEVSKPAKPTSGDRNQISGLPGGGSGGQRAGSREED